MTVGELKSLLSSFPDDMVALMDEPSRGRCVHIERVVGETVTEKWDAPRDVIGKSVAVIE